MVAFASADANGGHLRMPYSSMTSKKPSSSSRTRAWILTRYHLGSRFQWSGFSRPVISFNGLLITVHWLPITEKGTQLSVNGLSRRQLLNQFTATIPGRLRKRPFLPELTPPAALALSWRCSLLLPIIIFHFSTGRKYNKVRLNRQND